ncbi:MAG: transcription antitermination factor NusB [Prolixibacteraceae bacterium]|jgi:N utilization substance protein B|nr:transcription antitermination factor NusB [Prolixibacteraceae bacterium]
MISRRIIRTKVLQILYAHVSTPEKQISASENELHFSIQKTYDLYHLLLSLPIELSDYADKLIELRKQKNFPTQAELNPNLKFVSNRLIKKLRNNKDLGTFVQKNKVNWVNSQELVKKIYQSMVESEPYLNYLNSIEDNFQADRRFCEDFFAEILLKNEYVFNEFEEQSIYWNDDLDFVVSMVIKTLKKFREENNINDHLSSLYKDEEDRDFTVKLFRKTLAKSGENRKTIEAYTKNWDVDRVATMDILIMELALTELTEFPSVPIKVTLNEYIELAKYYSTQRSSVFINGVLDRITKDFKEQGLIVKAGRGLLEG